MTRSTPPIPLYLKRAIAEARALRVDDLTDAEVAAELGIDLPLVSRVRDEVRRMELPLSASIAERHHAHVERGGR